MKLCLSLTELKVISVIIGGILVNTPVCVIYYYGILMTYVDSYFIAKVGMENHSKASLWMTTIVCAIEPPSMAIAGILSRKLGPRLTTLIGIIACNLGVYLSFFTIQNSFWSLHLTFGVMTGIGLGHCFSMMVLYASVWPSPKRVGLATSLVTSAVGGGSFIFNKVTTLFINPANLKPDISSGSSRYFSQSTIIARTPYVFLVYGGITSLCQITGLLLLRDHPSFSKYKEKKDDSASISQPSCVLQESNVKSEINCNVRESYGALEEPSRLEQEHTANNEFMIPSTENSDQTKEPELDSGAGKPCPTVSFTPLQMLKTLAFYLFSSSLALLMVGQIVDSGYYKQFGLLLVTDDNFLADVGIVVSITFAVSRILWGACTDRFNVISVIIVMAAVHSVVTAFWYFTIFTNKWVYLFWTLLVQAGQGGLLCLYPVATLRLFGPDHYVTNFGIVMSWAAVLYVPVSVCIPVLLARLGWFIVFLFLSLASFGTMLLLMPISSKRQILP